MHISSNSLKVTAGALAIAAAVFGLTACGSRGGGQRIMNEPSTMSGISSAQFDVGSTLK